MGFFSGTPDRYEKISKLRPNQEPLANQAVQAGLRKGAGGAFGEAADYYRNNLSDNPADFNAFAAPQLRQYNQDIIPGISEQFAGMGAGGLSSSGFQNAQIQGATDLSERLGAIRANLRQQSAQGLQGIGQLGLQQFDENVFRPGTPGAWDSLAPLAGTAIGALFGPIGAAIGGGVGGLAKNAFGGSSVGGKSSPYGGGSPTASARPSSSNGFNLPNRGF